MFGGPFLTEQRYDPATSAAFNGYRVKLGVPRKRTLDALVRGLKAAGTWSKLDFINVLAAHDSQAALRSLNSPETGNFMGAISSPVFTTNLGYGSAGNVAGYLSGTAAFNALTRFSQNSATLMVHVASDRPETQGLFGSSTGGYGHLAPRNASNQAVFRLNASVGNVTSTATVTSMRGFWTARRNAANYSRLDHDGELVVESAQASEPLSTGVVRLMRSGTGSVTTNQLTVFCLGAYLTDAEEKATRDVFNTYLRALSADTQ